MGVYNNQLFVGTMDWSYLIGDILQTYVRTSTGLPYTGSVPSYPNTYGADLMRFGSPLTPAIPVSLDGLGNYLNYGIRTMLVEQKGAYPGLYLGTANPMNLKTDPTKPAGGWELHRFVQTSIW